MLDRLFGSTTRLKLLKAFLFQPEKRFTIEELVKQYKLKNDSIKRELENLLKLGLIYEGTELPEIVAPSSDENADISARAKRKDKDAEKDIVYFCLNKAFVLVEEIKTLIARGQILYERDFVDQLLTVGKIKYLMLTGFFVNRTDTQIDLLIVGRINKVKLVKIIKDFERELGREVNFTHFEPQEFVYRRSMADIFIFELLEGPNLVVIDEIFI